MTTTDMNKRLQLLEEKFLYQEKTIDALNEVILEQQEQLSTLVEEMHRLKMILTSMEISPIGGTEPPPPHY
ncbi:MAG: SlyX family protein [Desulforhopalus sp.]